MPTSGGALTRVALSATLHCLTGCAIGEVLGMVIGTALGFSSLGIVALAVGLAFLFGYALTSLPLLRAGLAFSAVVPIALASDTLSIATMELVDNAIMLALPGAMEAGVGSLQFWGSLSFALVVAGAIAVPVNRWLIARGKGHAVVHETGVHGGPSPRVVGVAAAAAFVFGSAVLLAEVVDGSAGDGGHGTMAEQAAPVHGEQKAGHQQEAAAAPVRGLSASAGGLTLEIDTLEIARSVHVGGPFDPVALPAAATSAPAEGGYSVGIDAGGAAAGKKTALSFELKRGGQPVTLQPYLGARGHLVALRSTDLAYLHVHPTEAGSSAGRVRVATVFPTAGRFRLFLQFKHDGRVRTAAFTAEVAR